MVGCLAAHLWIWVGGELVGEVGWQVVSEAGQRSELGIRRNGIGGKRRSWKFGSLMKRWPSETAGGAFAEFAHQFV